MTSTASVTYCERWDHTGHFPHLPLTAAEARQRFDDGLWFTVVVPYVPEDDDAPPRPESVAAAPDVVLEVEAGLTTVSAVFFDDDTGDVLAVYRYRRHGDTLLMTEGITYDGPEDGRRGLTAVVQTQQVWVRPEGTFDLVVDQRGTDGVEYADDNPTDLARFTAPVPAFGDWDRLADFG